MRRLAPLCLALAVGCGRSDLDSLSDALAAKPAPPSVVPPAYKDLGVYTYTQAPAPLTFYRAIVLRASTPQPRVVDLAQKLHAEHPAQRVYFFDDEAQWPAFKAWMSERIVDGPIRYPFPEAWARAHHIGTIKTKLVGDESRETWVLVWMPNGLDGDVSETVLGPQTP